MSSRRSGRVVLLAVSLISSLVALPRAVAAPTIVSCPEVIAPAPVLSAGNTLKSAAQPLGLRIGAAMPSYELWTANPQDRLVAAREFNIIASSNQMWWAGTEPQRDVYDFCHGDQFVGFAGTHGLQVRYHNLIAGNVGNTQTPSWVTDGTWTRDELISVMRDYIHTVVGHYGNKVTIWDVVNETLTTDGTPVDNVFKRVIGYPDYVELAFQFAREAAPSAKLMYDDTANKPGPKQDAVYALIQDLKSKQIPIDLVGVEMYGYAYTTDVALMESNLKSTLDRYASLGINTAITQMNVALEQDTDANRVFQASYYRAALDACLTLTSQSCHTFMMWGYSDTYGAATVAYDQVAGKNSVGKYGTIYDSAYKAKKAYDELLERLQAG